jgi:hypothetical protein
MKTLRTRHKYTTRRSLLNISEHRLDLIKNIGFDYEGKQIKKSISKYILSDPIKEEIISSWEILIFNLTEYTKNIKKGFNYAIDKKFTKFN